MKKGEKKKRLCFKCNMENKNVCQCRIFKHQIFSTILWDMDQSPHRVPATGEQSSPCMSANLHPNSFLSCPQDLNALTHLFSHDCGLPLAGQLAHKSIHLTSFLMFL